MYLLFLLIYSAQSICTMPDRNEELIREKDSIIKVYEKKDKENIQKMLDLSTTIITQKNSIEKQESKIRNRNIAITGLIILSCCLALK